MPLDTFILHMFHVCDNYASHLGKREEMWLWVIITILLSLWFLSAQTYLPTNVAEF